jgi:uncharacterized protein (DUF2237 family)
MTTFTRSTGLLGLGLLTCTLGCGASGRSASAAPGAALAKSSLPARPWAPTIPAVSFDDQRAKSKIGPAKRGERNVLGNQLEACSSSPLTGFYRDGRCSTGPRDRGLHVVCARMTTLFLRYTKAQGNDLSTPAPRYRFPGLRAGDRWCLCAARWREAHVVGMAPPVVLEATHARALTIVPARELAKTALRRQ